MLLGAGSYPLIHLNISSPILELLLIRLVIQTRIYKLFSYLSYLFCFYPCAIVFYLITFGYAICDAGDEKADIAIRFEVRVQIWI